MSSYVLYATIWFIVWLACLWLVWRMVDRKDLNAALWIILCIFFPLIILIVVALLPAKQRPTPPEMLPKPAACAGLIRTTTGRVAQVRHPPRRRTASQ